VRIVLALVLLIGCKDKAPEPAKPGVAAAAGDAAQPEPGGSNELSGKPPAKTTQPPARSTLDALAQLAVPGFARRVRRVDDGFLDVVHTNAAAKVAVTVVVMACVGCKPMTVDAWRADQDALAVTLAPELRDRGDRVLEIAEAALAGTKLITVYQLAHVAGEQPAASHAVVAYYNDGVTQLRVIAAYEGPTPATRDELVRAVPRAQLERTALVFADAITQAWAR
jgi:hypothetical protein